MDSTTSKFGAAEVCMACTSSIIPVPGSRVVIVVYGVSLVVEVSMSSAYSIAYLAVHILRSVYRQGESVLKNSKGRFEEEGTRI